MKLLKGIGVLAIYVAIAAVCTRPLLEQSSTHIAGDPGDPVLNASVLWWNAIVLPFSDEWWDPPYFHLTHGVSAFTENLVGITPLSTPIYWLTRNPLAAYNLSLFLTWPLSAFAVFLLVRFVTGRDDAGFVAGLAYGFTPYRTAEMGHIQMVASFWIPLALLGLHGFLRQRRARWLLLFGVCWVLQSLANLYLMLYGGVLIALWILYFCSTRETWRAAPAILVTWVLATLPLAPVLLKYRAVHEYYGLHRDLSDPASYSTPIRAWFEATDFVWLWRHVLPDGDDDLFPGVTALLLVAIAGYLAVRRYRQDASGTVTPGRRKLIGWLTAGTIVFLVPVVYTLFHGPWRAELGGLTLRVSVIDRALDAALLCGVPLLFLTSLVRNAFARRGAFFFYSVATIAMAIFSFGPVIPVGKAIVYDYTPYHWLMYVPGVTGLRVPSRFWMLGVLCLATAAGLAFARFRFVRPQVATGVLMLASVGLLADGWIARMPMADAPKPRPRVERRDQATPILELPFGPGWDAAATYRSIWLRRGMFNGVSGYDPMHYLPLLEGLQDRDPGILRALASFGAFDIVVDGDHDADGALNRFVSSYPGATRTTQDGALTAYRIAATGSDPPLGPSIPIVAAYAKGDTGLALDGQPGTFWEAWPQKPGQSISVDLGREQEVAGVTHSLGPYAHDFPRLLAIDVSTNGADWTQVWEGRTVAYAFRAAVVAPRNAAMPFAFAPHAARFVRLRQLAAHEHPWRLAELQVHAPAPVSAARP